MSEQDKRDDIEQPCGCETDGECNCDEDKECGCGHDHDHDHEGHNSVTLELEDGTELICPIIDLFEVNDQEYIALFHPIDESALLYRFHDYDDGTIEITSLEDDEYDVVSKRFMALQDEMEEEE